MIRKVTCSPRQTEELGAKLASVLKGREMIAMFGDLGAGKTAFTRGLASVFSPGSRVKSPSFTIVNEYRMGKTPLFHFDLYRLEGGADINEVGMDPDYLSSGISLIEWPERLDDTSGITHTVKIKILSETEREITLE